MSPDELERIEFIVEAAEDGSFYSITVRHPDGLKISQEEFLIEIESWIHEVSKAQALLADHKIILH